MTAISKQEDRVRRAAAKQGLRLRKSRARNPRTIHYGTYGLADFNNNLVHGDHNTGFGLSLEDIAYRLMGKQLPSEVIGQLEAALVLTRHAVSHLSALRGFDGDGWRHLDTKVNGFKDDLEGYIDYVNDAHTEDLVQELLHDESEEVAA